MKVKGNRGKAAARGSIRDVAARGFFIRQVKEVRENQPIANAVLTNANSDPTYIIMIDDRPYEVSLEAVKLAAETVKRAAELANDAYGKMSYQAQKLIGKSDRELVGLPARRSGPRGLGADSRLRSKKMRPGGRK